MVEVLLPCREVRALDILLLVLILQEVPSPRSTPTSPYSPHSHGQQVMVFMGGGGVG